MRPIKEPINDDCSSFPLNRKDKLSYNIPNLLKNMYVLSCWFNYYNVLLSNSFCLI